MTMLCLNARLLSQNHVFYLFCYEIRRKSNIIVLLHTHRLWYVNHMHILSRLAQLVHYELTWGRFAMGKRLRVVYTLVNFICSEFSTYWFTKNTRMNFNSTYLYQRLICFLILSTSKISVSFANFRSLNLSAVKRL